MYVRWLIVSENLRAQEKGWGCGRCNNEKMENFGSGGGGEGEVEKDPHAQVRVDGVAPLCKCWTEPAPAAVIRFHP